MKVKQSTSRDVTGMISTGSCVSSCEATTNRQGNGLRKALVASSPDLKMAKCPAARKNSTAEWQNTHGGVREARQGTLLCHLLVEGQRATHLACTVFYL